MDVNKHERLSNITLRHKLKLKNSVFIAGLHFAVTVRSMTIWIVYQRHLKAINHDVCSSIDKLPIIYQTEL